MYKWTTERKEEIKELKNKIRVGQDTRMMESYEPFG